MSSLPPLSRSSTVPLPEAFQGFFDDAAVFPPGLAPLERAVAEHVARRRTPLAAVTGPLVLPLQDLPRARQLVAEQVPVAGPVQVSVVAPAGRLPEALDAVKAPHPQVEITSIELKTSADGAERAREIREAIAAKSVRVFVELTAEQIKAGSLDLLVDTGVRLKFRTGGIESRLFPTAAELAAVLARTVDRKIPFKLTAGLHQAVRYTNPATGFTHHGFLNIAVATALAMEGAPAEQVEASLLETERRKIADTYRNLSPVWRHNFTSFGTCSVTEPLESLQELGLLPAGMVSPAEKEVHGP